MASSQLVMSVSQLNYSATSSKEILANLPKITNRRAKYRCSGLEGTEKTPHPKMVCGVPAEDSATFRCRTEVRRYKTETLRGHGFGERCVLPARLIHWWSGCLAAAGRPRLTGQPNVGGPRRMFQEVIVGGGRHSERPHISADAKNLSDALGPVMPREILRPTKRNSE